MYKFTKHQYKKKISLFIPDQNKIRGGGGVHNPSPKACGLTMIYSKELYINV